MDRYRLKELKIEVNRACPLHCLHCSSNGTPDAPEHLSLDRVCELVREFAYLGGEKLCISGGEPLCYEGLRDLIGACHQSDIQTSIYTSGIVSNNGSPKPITQALAALLSENNIGIIVSLHGARRKTHDKLTQTEGSFDATMTALESILKAGAKAEAHVVPTAINLQEIEAMTALVASFDIRKMSWLRFVPQGRGLTYRGLLQPSREQLVQLFDKKSKLEQMFPRLKIRTGAPFNILCPETPADCDAGLSVLTIRPDGSTAPCDAFKAFQFEDRYGSVLGHSLSEVWHKSYFLNAVRRMQETKSTSSCISCPLYQRCNSGCLAQKAIAAGRLTNIKDPECLLERAEAESARIEAVTVH